MPARYQGTVVVTFGWNALAVGSHLITAEVDSPSQISESREDNNRISLQVDFWPFRQFMPVPISLQVDFGPFRQFMPVAIR